MSEGGICFIQFKKKELTVSFTFPAVPEEQLAAYEKRFLDECLVARLKEFVVPPQSTIASQLVIQRISIECTCSELSSGEICATFDDISRQKWTEFMGKTGMGIY